MSFNINKMVSALNKKNGLLRSNHFEVVIPTAQVPDAGINSEYITMAAHRANYPNHFYTTVEMPYGGYGETDFRPTIQAKGSTFDVELHVDGNADIPTFFQKWMKRIGNINMVSGEDKGLFEFPVNYYADIEVHQYRYDGELVNTTKLINAFPVSMNSNSTGFDWGARDEGSLTTCGVSFWYLTYITTKME